jgi:PiT family inorganic phosphate transporter
MDAGLLVALGFAFAFAVTNGLHDASNAIATLVATRAATPAQALVLGSVFNMLGPFLLGAAVADTIGGIVTVDAALAARVIGSGLAAAVTWNLLTFRISLPSSSGHALVGGLVGAALLEGGIDSVRWGGLEGGHPVGVVGTLLALAVSPLLGVGVAFVLTRAVRRGARRATRRWRTPVRVGEWGMSAALAFSHGANDAQKSVGVIAALLLAEGHTDGLSAPIWVTFACAVALTSGTALGGWRIIRTVGHRIYPIRPVEGLTSQASSSAVLLGASVLGAPVSTTQVVASSVVGVGVGRGRWHHVHWALVREMLLAWLVTIPATGLLAMGALVVWRGLA